MINRPTSTEILTAIREELRSVVAPELGNAQAQMTLGLVDALLGLVATRIGREREQMLQEIDAVDRLSGVTSAGREQSDGAAASLIERYFASGITLAALLEDEEHSAHQEAIELLEQRLQAELDVAGSLTLVGRVGSEEPTTGT